MFNSRNSAPGNFSYSANEYNAVQSGRGVYAWIEHSGMFYNGDIPGVNGILHSRMAKSFDECLNEMKRKLTGNIDIKFSTFRQRVSFQEIQAKHPTAEIVFIPIK